MKVKSSDTFKVLTHVKIYKNNSYNTKRRCSIFVQNSVAFLFSITTYKGSRGNVKEVMKCRYDI